MSSKFSIYQILEKIAQGAYAEIFRVRKGEIDFALKKLKPHLKFDSERIATLKTEAKMLEWVGGEPHFPKIYEHGEEQDECFIIMELIEGPNLGELVKKIGSKKNNISLNERIRWVLGICRGVEFLHGLKSESGNPVIHGDLKPRNVMLGKNHEIKIIDLGLKGGTFDYIPIERLHDKIIGPYSDIYATGHILYELLHGECLLKAKGELETYFEMRDLRVREEIFAPNLPKDLKKILVRSLNQDPITRYASVKEMREDLEGFLKNYPSAMFPNTPP